MTVMTNDVLMAGFGGQGMLLAGKVLAHAAMDMGLEVSWLPSYGPEMREPLRTAASGRRARFSATV